MPELMDIVEAEDITLTTEQAITALEANRPKKGYAILNKATDMAIQALEEIQQYREIGTIEEFKHYKHIAHMAELAIDSVEKEKAEIRNKAIDEFVTKAHRKLGGSIKDLYCVDVIDEIAEQMKKGGEE